MVAFCCHDFKKMSRACSADLSLSFIIRRGKRLADSESFVTLMLVKNGIPFISMIILIISGKLCGLPRYSTVWEIWTSGLWLVMEMLVKFSFNLWWESRAAAMVSFTGHHLLLHCWDEVESTLRVVVANVLKEGFIKEALAMQLQAVAASFESTCTLTTFVLRRTLFLL